MNRCITPIAPADNEGDGRWISRVSENIRDYILVSGLIFSLIFASCPVAKCFHQVVDTFILFFA